MNKPATETVNIADFTAFIELVRTRLTCGHWLYRGVTQNIYDLIPKLGRKGADASALYEEEHAMVRRTFAGTASASNTAQNDLGRLLLAQHHGAPTRLLDWTSSAMVAAYFASEHVDEKKDKNPFKIVAAHVCPMAPAWTHYTVNDLMDFCFYNGYITHDDYTLPKKESTSLSLLTELETRGVIFVQGSDVSPRVAAQQAYVSIHKDLKLPLDQQETDAVTKIVHIEVPAKARHDFQDGLHQLGIRRRSIFPEIDSLFGAYEREQIIHERLCDKCSGD